MDERLIMISQPDKRYNSFPMHLQLKIAKMSLQALRCLQYIIVCDAGTLLQLLLLDTIHRPVFYLKQQYLYFPCLSVINSRNAKRIILRLGTGEFYNLPIIPYLVKI
jgi:hypothetical protein